MPPVRGLPSYLKAEQELSEKEIEVARLLSSGLPAWQVAQVLDTTQSNVYYVGRTIYRKLGFTGTRARLSFSLWWITTGHSRYAGQPRHGDR